MPQTLIALTALLIGMAGFAARHARSLLHNYDKNARSLSDERTNSLERSEKRWRLSANILSFLCLSGIPGLLTYEILQLTALLQRTLGAAITAGLVLLGLKLLPRGRTASKKWFFKDITIANQIALAMFGFLVSLGVAAARAVWAQPALRKEFLKRLFNN